MTDEQMLAKALSIAADAFQDTYDRGGRPYMLHCLAVMNGVRHLGTTAMTIAVLHDLLEDCPHWTPGTLDAHGFSSIVVSGIVLLTHVQGEPYMAYIKRLSPYGMLREIKMVDLRHNMSPDRLPDMSDKSLERITKYHKAYQFLLECCKIDGQ